MPVRLFKKLLGCFRDLQGDFQGVLVIEAHPRCLFRCGPEPASVPSAAAYRPTAPVPHPRSIIDPNESELLSLKIISAMSFGILYSRLSTKDFSKFDA